jgi:dihydropteroate synthase
MHRLGGPEDAPRTPRYGDVVREVTAFLRERTAAALASGVALERITLDPGIGFGKRLEDNLALLRALPELRSLGRPLLVGVSRKSFLSAITGASWAADKLGETAAAVAVASLFGADIVRVHDVPTMIAAARVAEMLADPTIPRDPHLRRDD